ncbi:MAG: CoA transferase [Rhizobiales bacterium]|nr:CoA transferase [Hyphomicrobiales bacterium]
MNLTGFPSPLSGLRVLDLTSVVYGPYATQTLGDFGADIIKIEPPDGDMTRAIGPGKSPDMGALYLGSNRNKRSIVLDLKKENARDALWQLIDGADMIVHNIRPQKMLALGFGPDAVLARKPDIIYGALLGYHEEGPYGGMPAYDDVIQGQSGLAGTFTARDGEPVLIPTIVADKTAALLATNGLLAAVIRRMASGKGVFIETSMFEGLAGYTLVEHQYGAVFDPPLSGLGYPRMLSRDRRPFPTIDGFICMMAYTDKHWRSFFELTGQPELSDDPRFSRIGERAKNIDALYQLIGGPLAQKTSQEWLKILKDVEIPSGPVNRLEDLRDDEHLNAVGFFRPFNHPTEGDMEIPDTPYRLDGNPLPVHRHHPLLGEHTSEILSEAGLSEAEIAAILEDKA